MKAFLGIDTSCYTTSVCLVDEQWNILADARRILAVKDGGRGLSQSNMVYQHTRNLPELFESIREVSAKYTICAVAVTHAPRCREDSYMPAFLAGLGYGRALAAVLHVPLYCISHQENHLFAILRCLGEDVQKPFYAIHLSGGTTDLLYAVPDENGWAIERIGGTSDISAGQFIDRVGVALGLPFPAGKHVDLLSKKGNPGIKGNAVFYKNGQISFSGVETKAQHLIMANEMSAPDMCVWTLRTVWRGLEKLLDAARERGMQRLVAAGGVMSNSLLRQCLDAYAVKYGVRIDAGDARYSADNATGAAFWAALQERKKR